MSFQVFPALPVISLFAHIFLANLRASVLTYDKKSVSLYAI